VMSLKEADLVEELQRRGLDSTGTRAELVTRLDQALVNEQQQQTERKQDSLGPYTTPLSPEESGIAKLFVGQVPPPTSEQQLRELFERYGKVLEIVILKDPRTGVHKGCAFVTYESRLSADKAIAALNEQVQLPQAKNKLAVRYAGVKQKQEEKQSEFKLYVGMLAHSSTEEDVRKLFEPYGVIKEIHLMRQKDDQKSKGAAFVKYSHRDEAVRAINALHQRHRDNGAPGLLQVRFAHTKAEKAMLQTQVGTLPIVSPLPLLNYGYYFDQQGNPYPQFPRPVSAATPATTPGQWDWTHLSQPLPTATPIAPLVTGTMPNKEARGPAGANLFIYNIPETYTDMDLASLFSNFGTVLSSHVQRDKATGTSKGFGFVSFDNVRSAQTAIAAMDGFVIGNKKLNVRIKKDSASGGSGRPY